MSTFIYYEHRAAAAAAVYSAFADSINNGFCYGSGINDMAFVKTGLGRLGVCVCVYDCHIRVKTSRTHTLFVL